MSQSSRMKAQQKSSASVWTTRKIVLLLLPIILVFATIIIGAMYHERIPVLDRATEEYMVSLATNADVAPGFSPALIYQCRKDGIYFCCAGTVYTGTNYGTQLITAEHIFRNEVSDGGKYGVRILRPMSADITLLVEDILSSSSMLEDNDIVVAKLGTTVKEIRNFSRFIGNTSQGKRFRFDVAVDGKPVTRMRSVLSGEIVAVLGAMETSSSKITKIFIVMNRRTLSGESGSGFVDDYGNLYVIHGSLGHDQAGLSEVATIFKKQIGTNELKGLTLVSGPVGPQK